MAAILYPPKRAPDGFGIHASHQFADVLFLAAQRASFRNSLGFEHCVEQVLVEVHCPEILLLQQDERFAEFL